MLLVVPEIPGVPKAAKPPIQGFGCRLLGDGTLSCEALYVHAEYPEQTLQGLLHARDAEPRAVNLAWSPTPPGFYRNASIDTTED